MLDIVSVAQSTVEAYAATDSMSFAYGQGSRFAGFTADSDLDIVIVWDGDHLPAPNRRPARKLSEQEPVQFHEPTFALDKLVIGGQDVDIAHYPLATFHSWCREVAAGDGWQVPTWPQPLHAVAGFRYGITIADPFEAAGQARERLHTPNRRLLTKAVALLRDELPTYRRDLDSCVQHGDGWLFHELATTLVKHCYVAWFAAEGHHCPFPKHLDAWVRHLGLSPVRARLARGIWAAVDLRARRLAIDRFAASLIEADGA